MPTTTNILRTKQSSGDTFVSNDPPVPQVIGVSWYIEKKGGAITVSAIMKSISLGLGNCVGCVGSLDAGVSGIETVNDLGSSLCNAKYAPLTWGIWFRTIWSRGPEATMSNG